MANPEKVQQQKTPPAPPPPVEQRGASHLVLRPFDGPAGRRFKIGERVDADNWRNVGALESQRYLRRLGLQDIAAPAAWAGAGAEA